MCVGGTDESQGNNCGINMPSVFAVKEPIFSGLSLLVSCGTVMTKWADTIAKRTISDGDFVRGGTFRAARVNGVRIASKLNGFNAAESAHLPESGMSMAIVPNKGFVNFKRLHFFANGVDFSLGDGRGHVGWQFDRMFFELQTLVL